MKKAIVFGASGMIGSHLLRELLNQPAYEQVTGVFRKDPGISHQKLRILVADFASISAHKNEIVADEVFIALGTTKQKTPDKKVYYQIDHDYPVLAATIALANGAKSVFLVSSVGADASSGVFYIRTKGETERDLTSLGYGHTHIFRPSMLLGDRAESRPLEKAFMGVWPLIGWTMVGPFEKYKGIEGADVACAMLSAAVNQTEKVKTYHWREMQQLLQKPTDR